MNARVIFGVLAGRIVGEEWTTTAGRACNARATGHCSASAADLGCFALLSDMLRPMYVPIRTTLDSSRQLPPRCTILWLLMRLSHIPPLKARAL